MLGTDISGTVPSESECDGTQWEAVGRSDGAEVIA
jgi:hypothetical protein